MIDLRQLQEYLGNLLSTGQLPVFLTGLAAAAIASFPLVRLLARWHSSGVDRELRQQIDQLRGELAVSRSQSETHQTRADGLQRERDSHQSQVAQVQGHLKSSQEHVETITDECTDLKDALHSTRHSLARSKRRSRQLESLLRSLEEQLDNLTTSDGRVWMKPVPPDQDRFLPLSFRRTPILSLMNLKGGVGKTTLAANLGATFAAAGHRVLLIDLDHQSSLSSMCLTASEKQEVERSGLSIDDFFRNASGLDSLERNVVKLASPEFSDRLYLAPATEHLADVENQLQFRWQAGVTLRDPRLLLRDALHDQHLASRYDLVLIDCPPRLTTACVNALAASDYLLIPVLLQDPSVEAVPRLLAWLKLFQTTCCAHLDVLGIIGNRAYNRAQLISRDQITWNALRSSAQATWGAPVRLLAEVIRDHATHDGRLACFDPKHRPRYQRLAQLIASEIPNDRLQSPALPPAARARS